ncbi:MAG: nuclear transport factor 2 family protein [Flammeovirgaceae bacterium]|nr:nuclear transport factor 2 family protein [Flammeovirgaceae bacterium]
MHIKNNPGSIENHEMDRKIFKVKISGDMALVTFDQENQAVNSTEPQQIRKSRILEREDGMWKLVQVSSFNKIQSMDVAISESELLH